MVVELHDDHFAPDCPDQTWLTEVGSRGWLVLTKDQRIRYRKSELQAVQEAGVGLFVLTAGQLTAQEIGAAFVSALPAMRRLIAKRPRPFVARVSRNGGVALLDLGGP